MPYRRKIIFLVLFFSFLFSSLVFSSPHSSSYKDSNILLSKSIGIWEKAKEYGYFKVIVYRIGLEHPKEKIRVLVTKAHTKKNIQEIMRDFELGSFGVKGYVDDISLSMINNRLSIALDIEMKGMDGIILREIYLVDINGGIKLVSPAKYVDIYD